MCPDGVAGQIKITLARLPLILIKLKSFIRYLCACSRPLPTPLGLSHNQLQMEPLDNHSRWHLCDLEPTQNTVELTCWPTKYWRFHMTVNCRLCVYQTVALNKLVQKPSTTTTATTIGKFETQLSRKQVCRPPLAGCLSSGLESSGRNSTS